MAGDFHYIFSSGIMPADHKKECSVMEQVKYKVVKSPVIARHLLKKGFQIVDIKPCKEDRRETFFVFEMTDDFINEIKRYEPAYKII